MRFSVVSGPFPTQIRTVRDQYQTVRDQYQTVRDQYQTVRDQYQTVRLNISRTKIFETVIREVKLT